jgi:methyl-accepting chemotaxis protein
MDKADRSTDPSAHAQRLAAVEAEVRDCLPAFSILRAQLKQTVAQVEHAVVDVCQSFQGMVVRARETMASVISSSTGVSAAESQDRSSQALVTITHRMLERTAAASNRTLHTVQKMGQVEEQMGDIARSLRDVDEIAKAIRFLGLNATIEAARAGEHGRTFSVVAAETQSLAAKATQISKSIQDLVRQLRSSIDDTSQELRAVSAALSEDSQTSRKEVDSAVDAMTHIEEELRGTVERSARSTEALADDIARAVVAMQFQDSMSQQVTHVVDALQGIEDALAVHVLSSGISADSRPVRRDWSGELQTFYTMQSERAVHAVEAGTGESVACSFGDNVEFF